MKITVAGRQYCARRHGSTLVIVIAMLGLLAIIGTTFYVFAAQEHLASEYFSDSLKQQVDEPDDPFFHMLRQLTIGPDDYEKFSILADPTGMGRHTLVGNQMGPDLTPHTGQAVRVIYDGTTGVPVIDMNYDGDDDNPGGAGSVGNLLNLVDSISAWGDTISEASLAGSRSYPSVPTPDVDYTYPDINNAFLSFDAYAVRDNGNTPPPARYELVRVIVPSFFRPQYLKSSATNDVTGTSSVPTDVDWYDPVAHPEYQARTFRPHPNHIGGYDSSGAPVYRYLEAVRDAGVLPSAGAFPFFPGEGDNTANFGHLGVWTGHAPDDFELDSDNDGDGIKEGIWMDLQYPVQETSGGRLYVPLVSVTIRDLDGLLNLNAVGNLAELPRGGTIDGTLLGPGNLFASLPLSASNQGLGPNEINPIFALMPENVLSDPNSPYVYWYGLNPSNRLEQANMEWMWLLTGRMESDGTDWTDLYPGRWGDANAIVYHKTAAGSTVDSLPRPGSAGNMSSMAPGSPSFNDRDGFDDNQDAYEGVAGDGVLRGFVHPMDFGGTGTNRDASDFRLPALLQDLPGSPAAWLYYSGYTAVGSLDPVPQNDSAYMKGRNGTFGDADDLSINHLLDALFEDPLETIMDPDRAVRPDDQIFSVQDILIGHLTDSDQPAGISTRLRNLLPSSFATDADISANSESDRSDRFTTLSHTLRKVALQDQAVSGPRAHEWTADTDGDGHFEFPPVFGSVNPYSPEDPFRPEVRRALTIESGDDVRESFQLLLSANHLLDVERSVAAPLETSPQYLNHMEQFGLRFHSLVEHPDGNETVSGSPAAAAVTALPATQPPHPYSSGTVSVADREYWARRERQKLARDIYVLLYTLGGPEKVNGSVIDYTGSNDGRTIYTEERLRQMAQFAVNLVDAMDTDNVVTRFEYDKDLNNGWGLDDLPWTSTDPAAFEVSTYETNGGDVTGNGLYPDDKGNRGVVYGVEAQQLAFSEVLGIQAKDFPVSMADDPATVYDDTNGSTASDTDGDRYVLQVELQNMLPMPVDLVSPGTPAATSAAPPLTSTGEEDWAVWRLARFDRDPANYSDTSPQGPVKRTLSLMAGTPALAGGERFTLAVAALLDSVTGVSSSMNPMSFGTADLWIDSAPQDGNFELIAPDITAGPVVSGDTPSPGTDLDTIHTSHDTRWLQSDDKTPLASRTLHNAQSNRGYFLEGINAAGFTYAGNDDYGISSYAGPAFDLVLQRRMNPNLPRLSTELNPWVEVDRIRADFVDLFDTSGASAALQLANLKSRERLEPLDAATADNTGKETGPADERYNSIGNVNDKNTSFPAGTINAFELWQPHFDRDYASVGELLSLPVIGPRLVTRAINRMRYPGYQQAFPDPSATGTPADPDPDLIAGAAGLFLQPDLFAPGTTDDFKNNAWYRLLNFVEVPSRVNRMLGNYVDLDRLPGKLNVNTIRHREVYAGLLDDPNIAIVPQLVDADGDGDADGPFLTSTVLDGNDVMPDTGGSRDRWLEFINERDGTFSANGVKMWLPGVPGSRPFRSLAFTVPSADPASDSGVDETLLRRLTQDLGTPERNRHWLEPGDASYHKDPDVVSRTANMVQRHQFLSKILNNTTTVSNCFIVYATVGYFEATIDPSGVVRVGGRMGLDLDGDGNERNDAGWEQRAVFVIDRTEVFNAYDEGSGSFSWEKLVRHRLDLASDGQ